MVPRSIPQAVLQTRTYCLNRSLCLMCSAALLLQLCVTLGDWRSFWTSVLCFKARARIHTPGKYNAVSSQKHRDVRVAWLLPNLSNVPDEINGKHLPQPRFKCISCQIPQLCGQTSNGLQQLHAKGLHQASRNCLQSLTGKLQLSF